MSQSSGVTAGGMFHTRKVKYNPETHALLKELLSESKLSVGHRNGFEKCLREGRPLPPVSKRTPENKKCHPDLQTGLKSHPRRRSLAAILTSGAYRQHQEYVPPKRPPIDYQKEKLRLQNLMAFGKNLPLDGPAFTRARSRIKREQPYDEMSEEEIKEELVLQAVNEIKENYIFLKEMELLGEAGQYRSIIRNEIAVKENLIKKTDMHLYEKVAGEIERWKLI